MPAKKTPVKKKLVKKIPKPAVDTAEQESVDDTILMISNVIDETVDQLTIEDLATAVKDAVQHIIPSPFAKTFRNAGLAFNRSLRKAAKRNGK